MRQTVPMTREEMREARRLLKPENHQELTGLITDCLKGPGHPLVEKLAFETLEKVRSCQDTLNELRRQLEEKENKKDE